ncbi:MAG: DoxX family protein [Actinomycetota bacterium]|nr:DoxX family protein [Actinomycetota bacterium]
MVTPAKDVAALAALFATSGALHLVRPERFERIVPKSLPARRVLVHASGIVELACAAGLLHPRTRRAAGWTSAGLLVAVFPANISMALQARRSGSPSYRLATIARLPLQFPMIRAALKVAHGRQLR